MTSLPRVKILIVTGIFPPDHGGPATYVPAIARALAERHTVLGVVTLSDSPTAPDDFPFPIHRIPRGQHQLKRRLATVATIRRLAKDADLVYLNGLVLEGILACKVLGARPVVVKVVGDLVWETARNKGVTELSLDDFQAARHPTALALARKLQGWYMAKADAILTPSRYLAGLVAGWGVPADRIHVVYNATYDGGEPPAVAPTADVVTVARLVPWKGIDALVRLAGKHGWTLHVVGDGPLRGALEALAREVGASGVVFRGQVAKADVPAEIAAGRVFVLNSTYEGLPHIVLEAKAVNRPVVASAAGGTPETITDGVDGLLVPVGDDAALEAAIAGLLADPARRERLAQAGLAQVRDQFSFQRLVRDTEALLVRTATGPEMPPARPLNVLLIGKDSTLGDEGPGVASDARARHVRYAELLRARHPASEIRCVYYRPASRGARDEAPAEGLRLFPTGSRHRATFLLDLVPTLRRALAGGWRPQVISVQTPWEEGLVGLALARALGARFVPQLHFDLFSAEWLREHPLNPWRRQVARRVLGGAAAVRVVSAGLRDAVVRELGLPPERVCVVPVGVRFAPALGPAEAHKAALDRQLVGHPVVLFVGRFHAAKNLQLWLDAAARIAVEVPAARFVLAGDGPEAARVRARAAELGLLEKTHFLGAVGHERLPAVYAAADVFMLSSDHEGFGRVIVEAGLAGVPTVATDCPGPRELLAAGGGVLVPRGEAQALAAAVVALLRDDAARRHAGAAAQAHMAASFAMDALVARLVACWEPA